MSCVPCFECGDGYNITRENLDRWTDSVANVLASSEGRQHLKRYLESRSFDESLNTVEFWERCVRIMPAKPESDSPPPTSESCFSFQQSSVGESSTSSRCHPRTTLQRRVSPPRASAVSDDLRRELELLIEFANNYVNLDLAQMRILYKTMRMKDEVEVLEALTQAKLSAQELLADDYQLFREHLLKSQGLLKS